MSGFETAIRVVQDGRRALTDAARATDATWHDAKRTSVEERTIQPLVRLTSDLVNDLQSGSEIVAGALRSLGRR